MTVKNIITYSGSVTTGRRQLIYENYATYMSALCEVVHAQNIVSEIAQAIRWTSTDAYLKHRPIQRGNMSKAHAYTRRLEPSPSSSKVLAMLCFSSILPHAFRRVKSTTCPSGHEYSQIEPCQYEYFEKMVPLHCDGVCSGGSALDCSWSAARN